MEFFKRSKIIFFGALLLIIPLDPHLVSAEYLPDSVESEITSQINEGSIAPIPPLFGEDQEDPTNHGTDNQGLLKINRVPNITFGMVTPSSMYQIVYAQNTNPYLQVSDYRGTISGWTLYAKMSDFISEPTAADPKKYLLSGAALTFKEGKIKGYHSDNATQPTSFSISLNHKYQKIFAAKNNSGQGIWASSWENQDHKNKSIELRVLPKTVRPNHNYKATISWQLSDVPQP